MKAPLLKDGDLVIENGEWVWTEGDDELLQSIQAVLNTRLDELDLVENHGLRYDNLLGKEVNKDATRSDIIEALAQEDRIQAVPEMIITDDRSARKRTVALVIQKEDGEQLNAGEVIIDVG